MKNILGLLLTGLILFSACSEEESRVKKFNISLTDAPGDYDAVYIDLQRIEVHSTDGNGEDGWIELNTNSGVYNLLDFTNGADTTIVNDEAVVGDVSQIRLILGDENSVVIDGVINDLKVPSGSQSGLKLNVHESLFDGITYNILLDFDAAKSVVKAGASGKYLLKPVIRTIVEAQNGAIEGVVLPDGLNPAVMAIQGEDTVASTYADDNGYYKLIAVPAGEYDLHFDAKDPYQPEVLEDVEVVIGNIYKADTVNLIQ